MLSNRLLIGAWFLAEWIAFAPFGHAASPLESLTIGYSSFSGDYVPLWIAIEDQLGKKYGLDLKAVYAGRARPQQLLISGETPLVFATGTGALTSHVLGVKDQVIILIFVNKVGGAIVSKPEINTAIDRQENGVPEIGQLRQTGNRLSLQYRYIDTFETKLHRYLRLTPAGAA